jgi:hypothetical protein
VAEGRRRKRIVNKDVLERRGLIDKRRIAGPAEHLDVGLWQFELDLGGGVDRHSCGGRIHADAGKPGGFLGAPTGDFYAGQRPVLTAALTPTVRLGAARLLADPAGTSIASVGTGDAKRAVGAAPGSDGGLHQGEPDREQQPNCECPSHQLD